MDMNMPFEETKKRKFRSVLRKTTVATLAVGLAAGSLSGVYADAKGKDNGNGNGKRQSAKGEINLRYSDLSEKEWKWAYKHIIRLASRQVFNGYEDGSFKPASSITRIEAIVASVRLLGLKDEAEKAENMNAALNFKDFDKVKKKFPWAIGYLKVALENDLLAETETSVQAEKAADRQWASILLVKALKLEDEALAKMNTQLTFKDAKEIPAGAVGYVAVALEKGLISGYGDNTFKPNKPVTRAELATLLDRAGEQLPEEEAQAVAGSVQSVTYGTLTLTKPDGSSVALALGTDVFVFREDKKVDVSAVQVGDTVLARTYGGKVVFIEVTKTAQQTIETTDYGTVGSFTLNAQGKIATLSLSKTVNGSAAITVYNVADNVVISGGNGALSPNQSVIVTIAANAVTKIAIQS